MRHRLERVHWRGGGGVGGGGWAGVFRTVFIYGGSVWEVRGFVRRLCRGNLRFLGIMVRGTKLEQPPENGKRGRHNNILFNIIINICILVEQMKNI